MAPSRIDWRAEYLPRPWRWGAMAALAVVAVSRSPYILLKGRFWGEEGALHFAHMYTGTFPASLFYVQSRTGYYNLFANVATWLATLVPLRYAPLVTAWLSFAVLLVLLYVALSWPSELLTTAAVKGAAAVLLLVGNLANAEVWLNTINAQTYLGLLAVLLLFVRVADLSRARYVVGLALLGLAGMSGLYAAALAPLFLVAAFLDRSSRRRWGFAAVVSISAVIQTIVVLANRSSGEVAESKMQIPGVGDAFRSLLGWHLGGTTLGRYIGKPIDRTETSGAFWYLVVAAIGVALVVLLVLLLWRAPSRRVVLLLVGALVLVEGLVQVGGLGAEASARYTVVPVGVLTLMLLYGVAMNWRSTLSLLGTAVLAGALVIGLVQFWRAQATYLRCNGCPDWAVQVQRYERDGTPPEIWPYDRDQPWVVPLPPR